MNWTNWKISLHYIIEPNEFASFENTESIKILVDNGADIKDKDGRPPLYYAYKQLRDVLRKIIYLKWVKGY